MLTAADSESQPRVRFFLANVLQKNRDAAALLAQIAATDPDIILLFETDQWWSEQLEDLTSRYPESVLVPMSNTYGFSLYSRLPLHEAQTRYLLKDDTPSVVTRVELDDGTDFMLWGLHPSPPRPGDDTDERDAELLIVAKEAAETSLPVVVTGDLNDVAWSATTTLFQEISGLLDPRIGRGLYATFNANWPLLKWPLDHLFASEEWTLGEFRTLDNIGSDHYPVLVELSYQPQAAAEQMGTPAESGDAERAEEHIEEGREAAREE
jgi:endonuclease/exonuclease/phosphatase (EEP) superfamily protein YafD